jgi:hypothetical protein
VLGYHNTRRQLRRELEKKYEEHVQNALRLSLDGTKVSELKAELQQLDSSSKLLFLTEPMWSRDSVAAITVAVICIALASLLWSTTVSRTNVSLIAQTESLRGDLVEPWHLDRPFQSGLVHLERLTIARCPNLGLSLNDGSGETWLRLDGGQVTLQSIDVEQGASLQITAGKGEVDLFLSVKPAHGTLTLSGKGTMTAGVKSGETSLNRTYDLPIPETVEFSVADPRGVPSEFSIHSPQTWSLSGVPLGNINFQLETVGAPGESKTVSGIKSGSIRFNDTSWPSMVLSEGELLTIHKTQDARIEARGEAGLVRLSLNGFVKNVTVGDSEPGRELAPSYLEYFYSTKSFAFFWGAIVFVWGLLWGIRKTIFRP